MPPNKKNTVKVCPENGNGISESGYSKFLKKVNTVKEEAVSQNQQQLAGMALAFLRGEMPDASEEVKKMAKMGEKELRKFAKTKHEGLPEKVKEGAECNSDDSKEEEDPRSMKTKINLVKNKLRAMGLKMSYEPEGEFVDEAKVDDDLSPEEKEKARDKRSGNSTFTRRNLTKSGRGKSPKGLKPVETTPAMTSVRKYEMALNQPNTPAGKIVAANNAMNDAERGPSGRRGS